ncbi:MFS transporter [Nonomuraea sp. SMC257]|uniref:MFS transporter n=1 Tax=Nonomuraea montanisoli TaxID=2741721 RepID=A0A7Y6IC44_9ACTN|nr:MFS transporter [Nonomuraea montanisoli]NUW35490.1 MFS transporter [Nonomuraea montanisoli]
MSTPHTSVRGHQDFRRLWTGSAISQLGSAVGMVALPVVAVTVVNASAFQVALLTALTAATTALLAFPLGGHVEYRRKRPTMIATDVTRFACLASVPVAAFAGVLTFAQLCVIAVVNAACQIAFTAASQAHLKALVSADRLVDANSRLESTRWLSVSVGPSVGGALVGVLTAVGSLAVDAVSFLFGALAVRTLRGPEPAPPVRDRRASWREELFAGWRFAREHPAIRLILISWVTFAGASSMGAAVSAVFYLRELRFEAWQYGLLMGVPSLGGFAGARLAPRLVARLGAVRALWWASMLRGPWYFLIPAAVPGPVGLLMCGFGFGMVLLFAGAANSTMTSYRQAQTPDHLMARVAALWSFATTVTQPLFILLGGLVATWAGARASLFAAAGVMAAAALVLPRE